jgi:16S rRNA (guanine1207-N2)-methyltransferase
MTAPYMPASELMTRHPDLFAGKHLLVAGQLLDDYPLELAAQARRLSIITSHFGQAQRYQQQAEANTQVLFDIHPKIDEPADSLLLYMPKSKQEAAYWLAALLPQLNVGADLFIVGENRGGVNAAPKLLSEFGVTTQKLDSARRCSLYHGELSTPTEAFKIETWQSEFALQLPQGEVKVASMPGVFNHGALDKGTELLLAHLPRLTGHGLDFGCGAGIIASAIAAQSGAHMTLIDVSAFAVESSKNTLRLNGLTGQVLASNGLSKVTGTFDFIVTNPPFHEGLHTHYETTERFLSGAAHHLKPNGELWVVANSFLAYEPIMQHQFSECTIIVDDRKFRVYRCQR